MSVNISWQPPLLLEARKQAQWECTIDRAVGNVEGSLYLNMQYEADEMRWRVHAWAPQPAQLREAARSREHVVEALRARGKPVV